VRLEVYVGSQERPMDYSIIIGELKQASLFDLYRLSVAINQQLENPRRLSEIKESLRPDKIDVHVIRLNQKTATSKY
jgi:hypothetical protein